MLFPAASASCTPCRALWEKIQGKNWDFFFFLGKEIDEPPKNPQIPTKLTPGFLWSFPDVGL